MDENHKNGKPETQSPGGIGGQAVLDQRTTGKDLRLLRAALKWGVPESLRKIILDEMGLAVSAKNHDGTAREISDRDRISAAKVVVAADSVDARREATDAASERAGVNVNVDVSVQAAFKVYAGFSPEDV